MRWKNAKRGTNGWRNRALAAGVAVVVAAGLVTIGQRLTDSEGVGSATAIRSKRHHRALGYLNGQRTVRGRSGLRFANRAQSECAQRWAVEMSETRLKHSPRGSCNHEGENVGAGPSLHSVFRAFWRSDPHRRNHLRRRWGRVAIGIVRVSGTWYVVEQFHDR